MFKVLFILALNTFPLRQQVYIFQLLQFHSMPQFIIIAQDYKDSEALNRRLAARPVHLERMRVEKAKGVFIMGGAKLNEQGNMYGSMLIVDLPDKTSVQNWIAADPYITDNVWETVEITLFRIADV